MMKTDTFKVIEEANLKQAKYAESRKRHAELIRQIYGDKFGKRVDTAPGKR